MTTTTRSPLQLGGSIMGVSAVALIVSGFLTWGTDAGLISGYARPAETALTGEGLSGVSASGGSWFGILTVTLGIVAGIIAYGYLGGRRRTVSWPSLLGPLGGVAVGVAAIVLPVGFVFTSPAPTVLQYSDGIGVYLAIIGGVGALVAGLIAARANRFEQTNEAPMAPTRQAVMVVIGVGVLLIGAFGSWIFDERVQFGTDPETQAQIDALRAEGTAEAAAEAITLLGAGSRTTARSTSGIEDSGPGLGYFVFILAGAAVALAAIRVARHGSLADTSRWLMDALLLGVGAGTAAVAGAWIASMVRLNEVLLVPGFGSFFTAVGGLLLIAAATPYLSDMNFAEE